MCAIIRNPTTSMPSLRACSMCCRAMSASVEWVAMRTDVAPDGVRRIEIVDGADARQQQDGDLRAGDARDRRFEPFEIGVRAEPVREARPGEPVTVADLDGIDAGPIERGRDALDVCDGIPVPDGMHTVAQRDVLDVKAGRIHAITGRRARAAARRSPVRSAADVMMSRLPAYFGR